METEDAEGVFGDGGGASAAAKTKQLGLLHPRKRRNTERGPEAGVRGTSPGVWVRRTGGGACTRMQMVDLSLIVIFVCLSVCLFVCLVTLFKVFLWFSRSLLFSLSFGIVRERALESHYLVQIVRV